MQFNSPHSLQCGWAFCLFSLKYSGRLRGKNYARSSLSDRVQHLRSTARESWEASRSNSPTSLSCGAQFPQFESLELAW